MKKILWFYVLIFLLLLLPVILYTLPTKESFKEDYKEYCSTKNLDRKLDLYYSLSKQLPSFNGTCIDPRLESIDNNKVYND